MLFTYKCTNATADQSSLSLHLRSRVWTARSKASALAAAAAGVFLASSFITTTRADIERFVARQPHQLLGLGPRRVAHGGEDGCSGAGEMFGGEAPEAR